MNKEEIITALIFCLTIFGICFLIYQHQIDETLYEKCIDKVGDQIEDDLIEAKAIKDCLPLKFLDAEAVEAGK